MAKLLRREKFLLNLSDQKITIFPIAEGEIIEKGDFVVVNTRTLEASRPKQESGHYAVGQAVEIVTNEYGVKW